MQQSRSWKVYFERNAQSLLSVAWERGPELTATEAQAIARSIAEFQLGESSEGKHLLRAASRYANEAGDEDYLDAIRLFIAEEQRHARDLARFMALNHLPLAMRSFSDIVFRSLRRMLGGLESSITVLLCAELIAKVYYDA